MKNTLQLIDLFFNDCPASHPGFGWHEPGYDRVSLTHSNANTYPMDIYSEKETGTLVFKIAAPGASKDDIEIETCNADHWFSVKRLTSKEKVSTKDEELKRIYMTHRMVNKVFDFKFLVEDFYDLSTIDVKLDLGVLSISIPREPKKDPLVKKISF